MRFPRQEYWSGLPFPLPGDLPDPAIKHVPPKLQVDSLLLSHLGNPSLHLSVQFSSVAQLCLTLCVRTKIRIFAPSCSHRYCTHKKNRHHKFFLLIFSGLFFPPIFFPFSNALPTRFSVLPHTSPLSRLELLTGRSNLDLDVRRLSFEPSTLFLIVSL